MKQLKLIRVLRAEAIEADVGSGAAPSPCPESIALTRDIAIVGKTRGRCTGS